MLGVSNCVKFFQIRLNFHVNAITINYHTLVVIHMDQILFKRVVALFCQDKNGKEYNKNLEMEILSVIKAHTN